MKKSIPHSSTLIRSGLLALSTCVLLIANSAFAQIDPNVKNGIGGNMQSKQAAGKGEHNPPADKGQHNPPDDKVLHNPPSDKGQHNPPGDKSGKTGETKMLLPAVKSTEPAKKLDSQKIGVPQTSNN
jgi:hypothetical protein